MKNTSDLIFDVPRLVQFMSGVMTLGPSDVIATGTPPGVGPLKKGDAVEVEIEGIGASEELCGLGERRCRVDWPMESQKE